MPQATPAVDLGPIVESISLLKDHLGQFDDLEVQSAFSRLLDHMESLRDALTVLEDLLRKPTSASDACQPDDDGSEVRSVRA